MTFVTYMSYHMTRKVVGVVTPVLKNGSEAQNDDGEYEEKPWAPFDGGDQDSLIAGLDLAFLLAYALGMFVSGHLAERIDLRYFLTAGMTARLILHQNDNLLISEKSGVEITKNSLDKIYLIFKKISSATIFMIATKSKFFILSSLTGKKFNVSEIRNFRRARNRNYKYSTAYYVVLLHKVFLCNDIGLLFYMRQEVLRK